MTADTHLICQHAGVAGDACLDCGKPISATCPACGAGVSPATSHGPLPYCEACGWPWILAEPSA